MVKVRKFIALKSLADRSQTEGADQMLEQPWEPGIVSEDPHIPSFKNHHRELLSQPPDSISYMLR